MISPSSQRWQLLTILYSSASQYHSLWLWLATMDHSLWLWLLGPFSASGLRASQPPWGVRPQGATTLLTFFLQKHQPFHPAANYGQSTWILWQCLARLTDLISFDILNMKAKLWIPTPVIFSVQNFVIWWNQILLKTFPKFSARGSRAHWESRIKLSCFQSGVEGCFLKGKLVSIRQVYLSHNQIVICGFFSDSVKLNRNINKFWDGNALQFPWIIQLIM